ncbi:ABCG transporter ABC Superfamily [Phytophthora palmivora]|uniref:ABCG transporter ABC Superfamily n=1 Tax=Phytophthora palmivora TaxID=4796 RepID=A0A2P4Y7Y4_9STRA|nr:ABCG transporter ABC Superfamily [Phytophthora palmivora]
MSRTVVHLNDEIPEVVLMNVEVFNSLFMSYCMQNTPSIWTTLGLIAIDGAQMIASMHDVGVVIQHMKIVKERVNAERARQMLSNSTATQMKELRRKTILVYTQDILNRYKLAQTTQIAVTSPRTTEPPEDVNLLDTDAKLKSFKGVPKQIVYSPSTLPRSNPVSGFSLRKVFAADGVEGRADLAQLELEYALKVRKVLYITEFMLLINYVEVIVPIIFSANLIVMYHLPNRVYYSQIDSMDDEKLWKTLGNVMLYCFLQLLSLVALFIVLWHRLHISAVRQLAFILGKQCEQIQTKLVFWVFYNVQATLQHFGKVTDFWEAAQVELHGFYSVERVREFITYNQQTSTFRALVILLVMPWPCVIITLMVDLIPLRSPSEGLDANYLFIFRVFLSFLVASIVVNLQFRHSIPASALSNLRVLVTSTITAVQTTGVLYGLSRVIGFPLPFGIITASPMWVAFLLIPLAPFLKRARSDPELWPLVINSLKVWVCQESLVVIYPTYFYIFTTLSKAAKAPFAFLLPIIKLILRNVMSRTVVHLNDEIPEVVLMNVEVFNSLFMSYCMQNTPSIWTTLGLIAIDGAQMIASMHDVENVIRLMENVRMRVAIEEARQSSGNPKAPHLRDLRSATILGYAEDILERHKPVHTSKVHVAVNCSRIIGPLSTAVDTWITSKKKLAKHRPVVTPVLPKPEINLSKVISLSKTDVTSLELEYALNVRKVLYITEFVILINYVEVIIPVIFFSMDDGKLWETLGNVMLYGCLQLVSLIILFLVLWQRLRLSGLRQLAFVLEKQGEQVQTKLVLWVFYNVQATLQHFGTFEAIQLHLYTVTHAIYDGFTAASDYTFKFCSMLVLPGQVSPESSYYEHCPASSRSNDQCSVETSTFHTKLIRSNRDPCSLSWSNLYYTVDSKKGRKTILTDVTGRCGPGELTAIMGPSGSGKTTLLDILADRICSGTIKGDIVLNGEKRNEKNFRAVSSYVAQEDSLLGSFTVLETLQMAARLTMPSDTSAMTMIKRIQSVIDDMGLRVCENTMVGDIFHKGISGGQKRRLSIAIEMLGDPAILLLDEPTSGLDSASTFNVIKLISSLTKGGRTIICTIHQPSSLVYEMFTNVVILTAGQTVYFGPRTKMINHFASLGYNCPPYQDPVEYFIDLANTDFEGHVDIAKLINGYASSAVAVRILSAIRTDAAGILATSVKSIHLTNASSIRQFSVLLHRNLLNNLRNPGIYWIRLVTYTALSFMVGTMYLSSNPKIVATDIVLLLTYVNIYLVFLSIAVLPFFIEQRAVFLRERTNSGLNVFSYVAANFIGALPGIFLIALSSTFLVGYLAGLNSYGIFLTVVFLSLVVAETLMHLISAIAPQFIIGMALGAAIFGWFILVMGLFVPGPAMPYYWRWAHQLGFLSYSFEVLLFNHFGDDMSLVSQSVLAKFLPDEVHIGYDLVVLVANALTFEAAFALILYKFHTGRRTAVMATRRPSVDQIEAQALEAAAGLKSTGAKLVCIDFDATFVTVPSAAALRRHVRRFFLLLVPLLCEAHVNVAIVTFSPQVQLIQDVLRLCFSAQVTDQLVIRGDDRSWTVTQDQTLTFMPLWQTDGRHLDRKFKLPFMISAALEVQRRSGDVIRNRDTVLVDDDVVNVRVANDSGVVGVYFDPDEQDVESFCKSIRKLHTQELEVEPQPTPLRTPSKKPRSGSGVKLVAKEHKFLSTGGARRRLGVAPGSGSGRTSTFNMCTPSPVMKLKCSVDMGKPRSKRASRILRSYSREMEAALPVVAESSTFPIVDVPTSPTKQPASLREAAETRGLPTSPIVYKM